MNGSRKASPRRSLAVSSARGQFESLGDRTWLNTAHQGVLPRAAAEAAEEAIDWKRRPWELTTARFSAVPARVRNRLARLLAVPSEEIVLANSSSYGIHLLANGFPWRNGDEALVVRGDFPSTYLPFLGLHRRGVEVRFLEPRGSVPTPQEVEDSLGPRTRMLCTTWVHSFNGHTLDAVSIGEVCRDRGVRFVLNASQGLGARPLAPRSLAIDALTCVGFKWLCGPYGTGFCWIRRDLLMSLEHNQLYWLAYQTADDLARSGEPDLARDIGGRRYDVFGTASFFNCSAWAASLDLILEAGLEAIAAHDQVLVERLVAGLDEARYELSSPRLGPGRSTLVFVSHRRPELNGTIHDRLRTDGVECALRRGQMRFSPHFYNDEEDIDRALEALGQAARHADGSAG